MIKKGRETAVQAETESTGGSDPILGGFGRAECGSIDWADMQVARLARTQDFERANSRNDDDFISEDERFQLNVLDANATAAAKEMHACMNYQQERADALIQQKVADAAYQQEELHRMAQSERIKNEFPGPTLRERVVYTVGVIRDWLGM